MSTENHFPANLWYFTRDLAEATVHSFEQRGFIPFVIRSLLASLVIAVLFAVFMLFPGSRFPIAATDFSDQIAAVCDREGQAAEDAPSVLCLPYVEAQEEVVQHFVARDAARALLADFPDNFGQINLFLDEFARPAHTVFYGIPSFFAFDWRRHFSLFLLLLTTAELIRIVWSLTVDRRKIVADQREPSAGDGRRWLGGFLTVIVAVVLFWWQPWVSYYGAMSLPATPLMYVLTAAVAAVLQRRFMRASLFFGLMPLLHHETIFLLLLWLLYLYRLELLHFFSHQLVEIFRAPFTEHDGSPPTRYLGWLEDAREAIGKENREEQEEHKLASPLTYVVASLLPYLIWNFLLLAYTNDLPMRRVVIFVGNLLSPIFGRAPYQDTLYQPLGWNILLDHVGNWVGAIVAALFIGALVFSGTLFLAHYRWWRSQDTHLRRRELAYLLLDHSISSRYTWWYFFLGYFIIQTLLLRVPNNPFESSAAPYYLLPIAPAIAIFAALPLFWSLEIVYRVPIGTEQPDGNNNEPTGNYYQRPIMVRGIAAAIYIGIFGLALGTLNIPSPPTPANLLPDGYVAPDAEIGDYERTRLTALQHEADALSVVDVLATLPPDEWRINRDMIGDDAEERRLRERAAYPIITMDPVLRLAIDEADDDDLIERLCPRALWAQETTIPFYYNLFPNETVLVISAQGLPSAVEDIGIPGWVRRDFRDEDPTDTQESNNGLQEPPLSIAFGRMGAFRLQPWQFFFERPPQRGAEADDIAFDGEESPNTLVWPTSRVNDAPPLTWSEQLTTADFDPAKLQTEGNPDFAIYRFRSDQVEDFPPSERERYARRYCGQVVGEQQAYAIVDGAPAPIFERLDQEGAPLIVREGSRLPALECVRTENLRRDESFFCLVAFPDRRQEVLDDLWDDESGANICYANTEVDEPFVNPPLNPDDPRALLAPGCLGWVEIGRNVYLEAELPESLPEWHDPSVE